MIPFFPLIFYLTKTNRRSLRFLPTQIILQFCVLKIIVININNYVTSFHPKVEFYGSLAKQNSNLITQGAFILRLNVNIFQLKTKNKKIKKFTSFPPNSANPKLPTSSSHLHQTWNIWNKEAQTHFLSYVLLVLLYLQEY